jgi:hypothetical protein
MMRALIFLLSMGLIFSGCSLYSSAGRKQFEDKVSTVPLQTYSLLGCRDLGKAETWLKEEFPASNNELLEMNPDYEVWAKTLENGSMEVSVFSKPEAGEGTLAQNCLYSFPSRDSWKNHRQAFLQELANSLVDLN